MSKALNRLRHLPDDRLFELHCGDSLDDKGNGNSPATTPALARVRSTAVSATARRLLLRAVSHAAIVELGPRVAFNTI
jgi:hypothetical protein